MDIIKNIEKIINEIYDYDIKFLINNLIQIFTDILNCNDLIKFPTLLNKCNSIITGCYLAVQKKDYLLVADLLEYELKPMIGKMYE